MSRARRSLIAIMLGMVLTGAASAQTLTVDEFRRELVGLPLCGIPQKGALAGKLLCTVHLPDGTAILAGAGVLARGIWEVQDGHICRRNAHDPPERRRCVDYFRVGQDRFRNSDDVEFCIGPCPSSPANASASSKAASTAPPSATGAPSAPGDSTNQATMPQETAPDPGSGQTPMPHEQRPEPQPR
jgi:hypothetical protein